MLLSEQLQQLLPSVRRFARASTDCPITADDCVEAALRALIDDAELPHARPFNEVEIDFYKRTEAVLDSQSNGVFDSKVWRAYLLVHLEQLSIRQARMILGLTERELRERLEKVSAINVR